MKVIENVNTIINELSENSSQIDGQQLEEAVQMILDANRVFIAGSGRSGFVGRAFANRLMHMGLTMYFTGETTTPSIREGDLLFVLSGSGSTASHVSNTNVAKKVGAKVLTITIFPENTIGSLADQCVVLPGYTYKSDSTDQIETKQLAGSMFEQLSWITCDAIAMELKERLNQTQDQMQYRHANME